MTIRFTTAASAVALVACASAPAFAAEQAPLGVTAAPVAIADQSSIAFASAAIPFAIDEINPEVAGVVTAAATEAAPIAVTAGTRAPAATPAIAIDSAAINAAAAAAAVAAQEGPEKRSESFTVVLNQDSFFGFYPTFNALIPVSDTVDLSVYGILWTTSDFSTNGGGGNLWTEFGIGANFHLMDGALTVKPQFGILNGALLSGGAAGGTGGNVFDGVVPNLTMNYSDDAFEAEFYGGYYAAVRNRNSSGLDFLHTWVNAGAKLSSNFSAGAHYEILSLTRNSNPGGTSANVYHWVGPYAQFSLDNGFFTRFTGGWDVGSGNSGDFYKVAVGFSF
jgi:hypothetical protein